MTSLEPFASAARADEYVPRPATERALGELISYLRFGAPRVVLQGASGMGKSLLLRVVAARGLGALHVVTLDHAAMPPEEIAARVLYAMGEAVPPQPERELVSRVRALRERDSGVALLVDDADRMPLPTLRRLSRIVQEARPALQLLLAVGDDEKGRAALAALEPSPEVVTLSERMSEAEVSAFVSARLARCPLEPRAAKTFARLALGSIETESRGVPLEVNRSAAGWWTRIAPELTAPDELATDDGDAEEPAPRRPTWFEEALSLPEFEPGDENVGQTLGSGLVGVGTRSATGAAAFASRDGVPTAPEPSPASLARVELPRSEPSEPSGPEPALALEGRGRPTHAASGSPNVPDPPEPGAAALEVSDLPTPEIVRPPIAPRPDRLIPALETPGVGAVRAAPVVASERPASAGVSRPLLVAAVALAVVASFALGRYTAPHTGAGTVAAARTELPVATPIPPAQDPTPRPLPAVAAPPPIEVAAAGSGPDTTPVEAPGSGQDTTPVEAVATAAAPHDGPLLAGEPDGAEAGVALAQTETLAVGVNAVPWAEIEIDGESFGPTPIGDLPLAPGVHEFRVVFPDGRVVERSEEIGDLNRHIVFR